MVKKISHMADTVVGINSFSGLGGATSEAFADYLGMFNIRKIAKLNTLSLSFHPDNLTYVFKMKRRKMVIERIHLPPELSVSKMKSGSGLLCSSGSKPSPIDF
eukprot:gene18948-22675_t